MISSYISIIYIYPSIYIYIIHIWSSVWWSSPRWWWSLCVYGYIQGYTSMCVSICIYTIICVYIYTHTYYGCVYTYAVCVCANICSMFMYMPMYPMWMRWGSAAILFTGELRGRGLLPAAGVNRGRQPGGATKHGDRMWDVPCVHDMNEIKQ